jgi:phage shock protein PspC (stress-responsive transcriptional regulator)
MEQTMKRLTRSSSSRIVAGICGGLAEYTGWDPVLIRVLYIVLTILSFGFGGVVLYLAAWIVLPLDEEVDVRDTATSHSGNGRRTIGILLVVVGLLALVPSLFPWFWSFHKARILGPFLIVGAGLALLFWKQVQTPATSKPVSDAKFEDIASEPRQTETGKQSRTQKRLQRSLTERKIAGICGGLGKYFDVDPTLIRLLWIVAIFALGTGALLYLVLWIAMPLEPEFRSPPVTA